MDNNSDKYQQMDDWSQENYQEQAFSVLILKKLKTVKMDFLVTSEIDILNDYDLANSYLGADAMKCN